MTIIRGATISVKVIDLVDVSGCTNEYIFKPPVEGVTIFPASPSFSFFLEHDVSGRRLLFDLGVPKDLSKLGSQLNEDLKEHGWHVQVKEDVANFLANHGVLTSSIEAVIWSHSHWDHKGDISKFPSSTDLVVGPTSIAHFIDGDGNGPYGGIYKDDTEGRNVREMACNTYFGTTPAMDYFNDGSLLLLDLPGHDHGHIGGDTAHHCSEYRPSKQLPMPSRILPNPQTGLHTPPLCPGEWFHDTNKKRGLAAGGPIYRPRAALDMEKALQSINLLQDLDANENILCIIAHDSTLRHPLVPFYPHKLNNWKKLGLRQHLDWSWVGEIWDELERHKA